MTFSFREPLFIYPGHQATILSLFEVIAMAALVMVLDHARGFAFVIWPAFVMLRYCTASGMTWERSKKAALVKYGLVFVYFVLGEFLLLLLLARESGQSLF